MGDTVSFINNGQQYAIPYCRKVIKILVNEGFEEAINLQVPFTDGALPIERRFKWLELIKWAEQRKEAERAEFSRMLTARYYKIIMNFWGLEEHTS